MTTLIEGELEFSFPTNWKAEIFDVKDRIWPKGISPVDFVVERENDLLLIEVKDPSAGSVPNEQRENFIKKMQTKELAHQELAPKARTSWSYLHLMKRTEKPIRFIVVIGTENLSIQQPLLLQLNDRLKKRLDQEAETAWVQPYVKASIVITARNVGDFLTGVTVKRKSTSILKSNAAPMQ